MTELEEVEIQIEEAQRLRILRDKCIKLLGNKQFKDVIETAYFKDEAARLVMAKSALLNEEQQFNIDKMIYGVGALRNFLREVIRRGAEMDGAIEECEQTRQVLLEEEIS